MINFSNIFHLTQYIQGIIMSTDNQHKRIINKIFTSFSILSLQKLVCALYVQHLKFGLATFHVLSICVRLRAIILNNAVQHNHKSNCSLHISDFLKIKINRVVKGCVVQLSSLH